MENKPRTGDEMIAAERNDQIKRGYSAEHDDQETKGQLAWSAALYAADHTPISTNTKHLRWPWPDNSYPDKRGQLDRIRQLTIAGALIAAEIDRLLRAKDNAGHESILNNAKENENPDPDNGLLFIIINDIIDLDNVSRLCDEDFRWSNLQTRTGRIALEHAIEHRRGFAFLYDNKGYLTWKVGGAITNVK